MCCSCAQQEDAPDFKVQFGKVARKSKFVSETMTIWGGSLVKGEDGFNWHPAKHHEISDRTVEWEDGEVQRFTHLERPQVYIDNGEPITLLCAADTLDESRVRHAFNIQVPLKISID